MRLFQRVLRHSVGRQKTMAAAKTNIYVSTQWLSRVALAGRNRYVRYWFDAVNQRQTIARETDAAGKSTSGDLCNLDDFVIGRPQKPLPHTNRRFACDRSVASRC